MKPHLPLPLLRAVLACFAALTTAPFTTTAAEPTVPDGYTSVEIDDVKDFEAEYANSNRAFLLTGATSLTLTPTYCSWWATGAELFTGTNYFFTSKDTDSPISLTFGQKTSTSPSAFRDAGTLEFQGLENVDFLKLKTNSESTAYGGVIYSLGGSPLTFSGNGSITFNGNYATASGGTSNKAYGGVIYFVESVSRTFTPLTFSGNGSITFNGNYATASRGTSDADIAGAFRGGAAYGGVIYAENNSSYSPFLTFSENGSISFIDNCAIGEPGSSYHGYGSSAYGGAIYADCLPLTFSGNEDITFSGNYASSTSGSGGAIFSNMTLTFSGNGGITFIENYATTTGDTYSGVAYGGAIDCSEADLTFSGNGDITFSGNYATSTARFAQGGAIYAYSRASTYSHSLTFSGNGDITFSGNYATTTAGPEETYNFAQGGAIYASSYTPLTFSGNGDITFSGNYATTVAGAARGGAISLSVNSTFILRGAALFERNYEVEEGVYRLRSVYQQSNSDKHSTMELSAPTGKSITFRDGVYADSNVTVTLNKDYKVNGVTQKADGDILFSGATMSADLKEIKGSVPTSAELGNSLSSELLGTVTLYGGRLIIEDGMKLTVGSFSTAEGSNATLLLKDARVEGYSSTTSTLSLSAGGTLALQGVNTITAKSLTMAGGTAMAFTLGSENIDTAVLTLRAALTTNTLTLDLSGTELTSGRYKLITLKKPSTQYDYTQWTEDKITVKGLDASFNDLSWDTTAGTLYLNYTGLPVLTTATWSNGSGNGLWDASSKNWTQDDYAYAYKDGVEVVFGDTGAGTVTLVGTLAPKSVLVGSLEDYTWSGEGKLSGSMTLTKQGTGKLTIGTANDYTGGTTISGGTLVAAHASALGTGRVQLNGGALQIAANGVTNAVSSAGTSYLVVDNECTLSLGSAVANTGNLTVTGALDVSTLTLTTEAATHVNTAGASGASGFAKTAAYSVGVITGGTTNGAGATVTHGSHTLVLGADGVARKGGTIDYSNYLLTGTDTVSVSAIRGVAGASAATVTQTGGTLTVDGNVQTATTGGTITLQSGTLTGTVSGATITATGGTLSADLTGNNSIAATNWVLTQVINNSGTLTLSGSVKADALGLSSSSATHVNTAGASGASGFAKTAAYSVGVITGGTTNGAGATVTHGSHTMTLGADGVAREGGTIDYSNYLLTGTDTVSVSAIRSVSGAADASVTQTGGTLTVDGNVQTATTGGTITLQSGVLSGTVSGATINATGGTLAASLSGLNTLEATNWTLTQSISNNGTLPLRGTVKAGSLAKNTISETLVDVNGIEDGVSGFSKSAGYTVQVVNGGMLVSDGATVTYGADTLTMDINGVGSYVGSINYGVYTLAGTDEVSVSSIHHYTAAAAGASVTQLGGTLTVDKDVTVTTTGGNIVLANGTLSGSISGASITAAGGTLAANLTDSNSLTANNWALTQTISNSGTLILSGSVNASALAMSASSETLVDVNGTEGGVSGFSKSSGYTVQVVNGGTLVMSSGATVTYGADTLTMGSNGIGSHGGGINYGKYTLAGTDAVSVSTVHGIAGAENAMVNQTGGTLTVDGNVTVATTGGAITLQNGVLSGTVNGASITATGGTLSADLTGSNSITANKWALTQVISNSGTLTLSGSVKADALELESSEYTHVDVDGNLGASGFAKTLGYAVTLVSGGTTNGEGAIVTHGSHTLTLGTDGVARAGGTIDYSNYLLTDTDTVSVSAIRSVAGASAATVTQTGGTLTVDGNVQTATTGGTITLQSGTLTGTVSGATITAAGGTLSADLTGNNSIAATDWVLTQVINNSGTLTLSGSFDASALTKTSTGETLVDVTGREGGVSGFSKSASYTVQVVNGGTLVLNGAMVKYGTDTLTMSSNGIGSHGGGINYGKYTLAGSDAVSVSAVHRVAGAETAMVNQTGGTLTVDENVSVATTGGSMVLTGGTLSGSIGGASITAASGTLAANLTGSNSITANDWALKQVITNSGTLTLSGSFDASALTKISTGETLVDVNGREGGASGFSKSASYTVQVVNGGTTVLNGATVKYGTDTLTMSSNGTGSHGGGINYGMYTLAGSDAVSVSAIHDVAGAANATVTQTGGTLTVDEDVTVATTGGMIALENGVLSGSIGGTAAVEVRGSGSISGDNSYTGGTTLTAGTLTVGSAKALGTGRVSMSGGALNLGGLAVANDITATGGTLNRAAAYTGKLTVQGGLRLGGATKAGSVTLSSGTLSLGGQTLTSGTMTLAGGVLDFASGSSLEVTGALTLGGSTAVKFYTATAGTYELATVGSLSGNLSSLTLDGLDRSRYGWSVSGNKLLLTLLTAGSTAWDSSQDGQDVVFNGGEDITIIGDVKPDSVVVNGDGTTTWNGPGCITGDTSVIKNGSGTLVVNNENTYTGGTILNDGTISVKHDNALGSGPITMNGGTLEMNGHDLSKNDVVVNSGCTLDAGNGGKVKTLTLDQPQKFSSLGNEYFDAATGLLTLKGSLIVKETLEVKHGVIGGKDASITAGSVAISGGTIDTKLLGNGVVTKTGSGEAKILGNQSYTGLTHVKGGTLSVYGSLDSKVQVDAGARLRLEGAFNGADMLLAQGARLVTKSGLSIGSGQNLRCSGTIVGDLTLSGGTVTATPGDFLSITGTLTLAGNTRLVLSGSGWGAGSYDLFQFKNLSGSTDYATFFGLTDGSIAKVGDKLVLTLTQAPSSPLSLRTFGSSEENADEGSDEAVALASDADGAAPGTDDDADAGTPVDGNALLMSLREALRRSNVGHVAIQSTWSAAAAQREFSDLLRQRRLQGGTGTAWVSMLGGHSRMSGTGGSDVNRMGGALGVELTVSESGNIGLAAGSTWSRLSPENHGRLHQNAQSVGLYGNAKLFGNATDSVWLSWDAAYGRTRTHGPVWNGSESWTQQSAVLATRATWARMIGQNTAVQGFGGLEYLALDSAKVQGERTGSVQNLRGEIGAGITHNAGRASVYAEAALVGDMLRHNPVTTFDGIREQGLNPGRVGLKMSVGGSYRLNDTWSANAAYTLEAAEHNTQHSANIGVSYTF
ncbi:MAG: autotransporter-associated beta strand repeat-containing protein [Akkermansia muciniphila]|nr:autotransporter-associated beta strand repeat-containing protein [Akkermansia muciniphila]